MWPPVIIPHEEEMWATVTFAAFIALISVWLLMVTALAGMCLLAYLRVKEDANL